jgi:hypothetical protein
MHRTKSSTSYRPDHAKSFLERSAQHCPEYVIPKRRAYAEIPSCKSMMALVMPEQSERQFFGTVMGAVMHEQIPGIGD